MSDDVEPLTVAELVDYCRTQAGLLAGQAEVIGEEADALLDELDDDLGAIRSRLGDRDAGMPTEPGGTTGPEGVNLDQDHDQDPDLDRDLDDLEERQTIVDAKRARMAAFQDLAGAYLGLAEELEGGDNREAALDRVLALEREFDAPPYFAALDRTTLLEMVARPSEDE